MYPVSGVDFTCDISKKPCGPPWSLGGYVNAIARFFLRAMHWQMFFLFFGIFLVANMALLISISTTVSSNEVFGKGDIMYGGAMVLFTFCFIGWFWSLGVFLRAIVDPALRLKMGFFRFAVIYVLLYVPIFFALFDSITVHPAVFGIIFPLHLFAVYCMFYLLYFVSKSLVLAESGKPVSFYDYSGPFFLLWFFPVGIWIVQPRINRLYEQNGNQPLG